MTILNTVNNLSKKQQEIVDYFEQGQNIFITGGAGSGKSHLLNFLKKNYSHLGLEITASTGISAVNVGGATIHSWAGIGLANLPIDKIIENLFSAKFARVRKKIKSTKTLAIDEISMVSLEVLEILDQVFKAVRGNNLPMGGIQMMFFGDFLQLPPIGRNNEVSFCFQSPVWQSLGLKTFVLEEIFRQDDAKFIKILNNIRFGNLSKEDISELQKRLDAIDDNPAIKPTILSTHNYKVDQINQSQINHIPRKVETFEAEYFGNDSKIEFLKKNSIVPQLLQLKIGAQVMMIKNTYQKEGIVNGSLGVVIGFSPKKNYPVVEFYNKKIITITKEEWLIDRYDENKGLIINEAGVIQIPLVLSWAITIHKSQGLTLDKISCDLSDVFSPGQAYVALSRAKSLEGVFIDKINFSKITANQVATKFYLDLQS